MSDQNKKPSFHKIVFCWLCGLEPRRCFTLMMTAAMVVGCEQGIDIGGSTTDVTTKRRTTAQQGDNQPGNAADTPTDPARRQAAAPSPPHAMQPANSAIPSRRNPVGHAIALASIRSLNTEQQPQITVMDPADNETAERREAEMDRKFSSPHHNWLPIPHRINVRWGRQRPAIELREERFFTIVGAVLIQPAAAVPRPTFNASAPRMPDLSQNLRPQWPGLCGATAAADVLYQIGHRDPAIIAGYPFGPAPAADRNADRLIAGVSAALGQPKEPHPAIAAGSLAGRMGNKNGHGATALAITMGLRSWLEDHVGDSWRADLAFLDDAPGEQSPAEQRAWFGRLGATIASGGGCLLLLWEGADWADQPTGCEEDRLQDADPRFPPLPPLLTEAQGQANVTGGAVAARSQEPPLQHSGALQLQTASVRSLQSDLEKARTALAEGRHDAARQLAEEVLEAALAIRFNEPGVESLLDDARSITAQAERVAPRKSRARGGIRTRYDG